MRTHAIARLFDRLTVEPDGCWKPNRSANASGYQTIRVGTTLRYCHRVAYEFFRGSISDGLVLDHLCRNPWCCNPDHLEAVTNRENCLRGESRGAIAARTNLCEQGHSLDGAYSYGDGRRHCRTCHTRYVRTWNQRKRAAA